MVNISPWKKVARMHLKAERDRQEEGVQAALLDIGQGLFKSLSATAKHHNIPYKMLYNCNQGRKSHSEAFGHLQALPPDTEDLLVQHISKQARFGFPVTWQELKTLAEQLLWQKNGNNHS